VEVPTLVLALAILFVCNLKKQVKKTNRRAKQEGVLALVPVPVPVPAPVPVPVQVQVPVPMLAPAQRKGC